MKKVYSIGYIDMYGDFQKFKDRNGYTVKYATIEECREIIKFLLHLIMQCNQLKFVVFY